EARAGVVVGQDGPVAPAVDCEALGAPLAHADAVAPAAAVDHEGALRSRGRRDDEQREEERSEDPHGSTLASYAPNAPAARPWTVAIAASSGSLSATARWIGRPTRSRSSSQAPTSVGSAIATRSTPSWSKRTGSAW